LKISGFDISASYGHFKKPYTTTLPYIFNPTRTAVSGIIAAVLGLEKKTTRSILQSPKPKLQ